MRMNASWTLVVLFIAATTTASAAGNESVVIVDPLVAVRVEADVKPAGKVVRLIAPRNGVSSASVVKLGKSSPATISALKAGDSTIPANMVKVRYASMDKEFKLRGTGSGYMFNAEKSHPQANSPFFDILNDTPQTAGSIHPIWVTVTVPPDAKVGKYTGKLTVGKVSVPVELTVSAYALPHPRDWVSHAGIDSSPETMADRYKVKRWSEAHWKLLESSFKFAQGLGDNELLIPLLSRTSGFMTYSHDRSWIDYSDLNKPDFSIVDKYIELYIKTNGAPPRYLTLDVWRTEWYDGAVRGDAISKRRPGGTKRSSKKPAKLSICNIDGTKMVLPMFNTPEGEKMWTAIFKELLVVCEKHKIDKNSLAMGMASDGRPTKEVTAFFKKIAPYARWQFWTHGRGEAVPTAKTPLIDGRLNTALYTHPYVPNPDYSRIDCLLGGWNDPLPVSSSARNALYTCAPLSHWRTFPSGLSIGTEYLTKKSYKGNGATRVLLDYWPVDQPRWALYYNMKNMFRNNSRYLTAPGPKGPLGTVRYETLREGFQELEARIVIEKGIMSKKLPKALDMKLRAFMKEYIKNLYGNGTFEGGHYGGTLGMKGHLYGVAKDWQKSTTTMFHLAGEVQRAGIK